jgi:hypothetical protein
VADFHGLAHFPNVLIVKSSLWRRLAGVNIGYFLAPGQFELHTQKSCPPEKKGCLYKNKCKMVWFS